MITTIQIRRLGITDANELIQPADRKIRIPILPPKYKTHYTLSKMGAYMAVSLWTVNFISLIF